VQVITDVDVRRLLTYHPPNVLVGTPYEHGLTSLGAVVAGDEQRMLFCSVGLAGTESCLLDRLLG
jgi:hypothetical protein